MKRIVLAMLIILTSLFLSCANPLKTHKTTPRLGTTSGKSLFISDMHPERGTNNDLINYLKKKNKEGYVIVFLGDSRVLPPDTYREIKHIPIMGNHEIEFHGFRHEMLLNDETLLIHGHNAELRAFFPFIYLNDIIDYYNATKRWNLNKSQIFTLGKHIIKNESEIDSQHVFSFDSLKYLEKLASWIKKRYPKVRLVIKGHDHTPYKIKINGILFYNTGAGWKGQHITQENGKFYWHHFE